MICVLDWGCLPLCVGIGEGGGRSLPPRGSGNITIGKIWIFYIRNHAFRSYLHDIRYRQ